MASLSVAVVGAGPAGATAARLLAAKGARVVLLEARRLPRPKACGGGLTPKAQNLVPASALDTVERRIHRVDIRGGRLRAFSLDDAVAEIAMVERASFDLALVEAAATAGVEVFEGERVVAATEDERGVAIATRSGRLRVDRVVVADGAHSLTARHLCLGGRPRRHALVLEVDVPLTGALRDDTAILSFSVPGGYAWYFPKGDHANIGVGSSRVTTRSEAVDATLRTALRRFAASLDLDLRDARIAGYWLPQGLRPGRLSSARALLAGDAAATAEPLLGEGISYAIASAIVAAQAILDVEDGRAADLTPYDACLRGQLGPLLRRLRLAAFAADRLATPSFAAMRFSRWVRTYAVDIVAGRGRLFTPPRAAAQASLWSPLVADPSVVWDAAPAAVPTSARPRHVQ